MHREAASSAPRNISWAGKSHTEYVKNKQLSKKQFPFPQSLNLIVISPTIWCQSLWWGLTTWKAKKYRAQESVTPHRGAAYWAARLLSNQHPVSYFPAWFCLDFLEISSTHLWKLVATNWNAFSLPKSYDVYIVSCLSIRFRLSYPKNVAELCATWGQKETSLSVLLQTLF